MRHSIISVIDLVGLSYRFESKGLLSAYYIR